MDLGQPECVASENLQVAGRRKNIAWGLWAFGLVVLLVWLPTFSIFGVGLDQIDRYISGIGVVLAIGVYILYMDIATFFLAWCYAAFLGGRAVGSPERLSRVWESSFGDDGAMEEFSDGYRRTWFILLAVFLLLGVGASLLLYLSNDLPSPGDNPMASFMDSAFFAAIFAWFMYESTRLAFASGFLVGFARGPESVGVMFWSVFRSIFFVLVLALLGIALTFVLMTLTTKSGGMGYPSRSLLPPFFSYFIPLLIVGVLKRGATALERRFLRKALRRERAAEAAQAAIPGPPGEIAARQLHGSRTMAIHAFWVFRRPRMEWVLHLVGQRFLEKSKFRAVPPAIVLGLAAILSPWILGRFIPYKTLVFDFLLAAGAFGFAAFQARYWQRSPFRIDELKLAGLREESASMLPFAEALTSWRKSLMAVAAIVAFFQLFTVARWGFSHGQWMNVFHFSIPSLLATLLHLQSLWLTVCLAYALTARLVVGDPDRFVPELVRGLWHMALVLLVSVGVWFFATRFAMPYLSQILIELFLSNGGIWVSIALQLVQSLFPIAIVVLIKYKVALSVISIRPGLPK